VEVSGLFDSRFIYSICAHDLFLLFSTDLKIDLVFVGS
jgi:hypothetical protein